MSTDSGKVFKSSISTKIVISVLLGFFIFAPPMFAGFLGLNSRVETQDPLFLSVQEKSDMLFNIVLGSLFVALSLYAVYMIIVLSRKIIVTSDSFTYKGDFNEQIIPFKTIQQMHIRKHGRKNVYFFIDTADQSTIKLNYGATMSELYELKAYICAQILANDPEHFKSIKLPKDYSVFL